MAARFEIYGVRHHGPGSARQLAAALAGQQPDCVLVEGPPEANDLVAFAADTAMTPPVALLAYRTDKPEQASFWPFAEFSPEWQALQYALAQKLPFRFIDLPAMYLLAERERETAGVAAQEGEAEASAAVEAVEGEPSPEAAAAVDPSADRIRRDPIGMLAALAGYDDGERWWEHVIEHRGDDRPAFAAVMDAMSALREAAAPAADPEREARREAHMRQMLRAAIKDGYQNIAVVCGAWHAPVLDPGSTTAKADAALLKGLPKAKVAMTWTPWTHRRLCFASGYGAGIEAPGWYLHLWNSRDAVATRWLTRAAQALRAAHVDISSAHVIEAVRLSQTLAHLRGREQPDLSELTQAAISVMCDGNPAAWSLVSDVLLIADRLGSLPESVPIVPLARDIADQQKSLRLPSEPIEREVEFDLRKPLDLARSSYLHRLRLLGIHWGTPAKAGGEGSFREAWKLSWKPEFAVRFIEANVYGGTLAEAAANHAIEAAAKAEELNALVQLLDGALFADLPVVAVALSQRLQAQAARQHDTLALMQALPRLAELLRYGNVRGQPPQELRAVTDEIVARIAIGYPAACRALDDEAAEKTWQAARNVHRAVSLIEGVDWAAQWQSALARLPEDAHGWLAGSACRWRYDAGALEAEVLARRINLHLSQAADPAAAACWMEGLLGDSALPLVLDGRLLEPLDEWITALSDDHFQAVLPLLRRSFSRFPEGERRQLGERVQRGPKAAPASTAAADIDERRARLVLPTLALLLGCSEADLTGAPL